MAYTAWSVVFGEQPTAAKWNQLGTNDAGFKDGTNFDNDIIKSKHIDWAATGGGDNGGIWWEELGRTTLGSANATMTVSGFAARKYLRILAAMLPSGGAVNGRFTFNNDSGSNYAQRFVTDYGTPSDLTSQQFIEIEGGNGQRRQYMVLELMNFANQTKLGMETLVHDNATNLASTVPAKFDSMIKYNSNSQVTRFDLNTTTNSWAAGSEVVILGHD